jgi:hypothetical protein
MPSPGLRTILDGMKAAHVERMTGHTRGKVVLAMR